MQLINNDFNMLNSDGIQARVPFTSLTIGSVFGIFMCDNGEPSC